MDLINLGEITQFGNRLVGAAGLNSIPFITLL